MQRTGEARHVMTDPARYGTLPKACNLSRQLRGEEPNARKLLVRQGIPSGWKQGSSLEPDPELM